MPAQSFSQPLEKRLLAAADSPGRAERCPSAVLLECGPDAAQGK